MPSSPSPTLAQVLEPTRLLRVFAQAPEFVVEFDAQGAILYANRLPVGTRLEEVLGSPIERWMLEPHRPAFRAAMAAAFATGEQQSFESVGAVLGRSYVSRISPITHEDGTKTALLVTHDVTERVAAERRLRESEHRFRKLSELHFEGVVLSVDGVIVDVNDAAAKLLGATREQLLGVSALDLATPESGARIVEQIRAGHEGAYEVELVSRSGERIPAELRARNVEWEGRPARVTTVVDLRDQRRAEAERRRAEERAHEAQKLETLGLLAGGIAHDVNNLLHAVLVNAELALARSSDLAAIASLGNIRQAALDGRALVGQLQTYAGRRATPLAPVDLVALIGEMSELFRVSVPRSARLEFSVEPARAFVMGDRAQLQQVLLNLVVNAGEAIDPASGRVEVRVRERTLAAGELERAAIPRSGPQASFVSLAVIDDGVGLDPAIESRVFDPFFSTKSPGRGLGLTTVSGTVRAHGGALRIESRPGRGATFEVLLPLGEAVPSAVAALTATPPVTRLEATILVADDEPRALAALQTILTAAGATARVARSGREAIALYDASPAAFDVALLDVTMPDGTGLDVVEHVRRRDPRLPIVLVSGHATVEGQAALAARGVHLLTKPARTDEILSALSRALGRS